MIDAVIAIQTAVDATKKLRDLSKKVGDADIKMALADLADSLADAKLAAAELKGRLAEATEENQRLNAQLSSREADVPVFKGGLYYFGDDAHPFCTACWDVYEKKVRIKPMDEDFKFAGDWMCPNCKATYFETDA